MYLDAVNETAQQAVGMMDCNGNGVKPRAEVYDKWRDWLPSDISHHGKPCCSLGREWVTSTDFSSLGGSSVLTGPRWLRHRFKWGASSFPIYWCEAIRKETLDCGALAALANEVFMSRGVTSYRLQMVQRFSEVATFQWACRWEPETNILPWTNEDIIYHEGCAVDVGNGEVKVWDASAGWWVDPQATDGYGSLLALRLSAPGLRPETTISWGDHVISPDKWMLLNA